MATTWRCNWCGRKQPIEALAQAVQSAYEFRDAFGQSVVLPTHNCCPAHDTQTRRYLDFCPRWLWLHVTSVVVGLLMAAVADLIRSMPVLGVGIAVVGLLAFLTPVVRGR